VAWWQSRPGDSGPRWRPEFLDEAAIGARRKGVGVGGARVETDGVESSPFIGVEARR
jgi:hypothetical protein